MESRGIEVEGHSSLETGPGHWQSVMERKRGGPGPGLEGTSRWEELATRGSWDAATSLGASFPAVCPASPRRLGQRECSLFSALSSLRGGLPLSQLLTHVYQALCCARGLVCCSYSAWGRLSLHFSEEDTRAQGILCAAHGHALVSSQASSQGLGSVHPLGLAGAGCLVEKTAVPTFAQCMPTCAGVRGVPLRKQKAVVCSMLGRLREASLRARCAGTRRTSGTGSDN